MIDAFGKELNVRDEVIYITKSTGKYASSSPFKKGRIEEITDNGIKIRIRCLSTCLDCWLFKNLEEQDKYGCSGCQEFVTVPLKYVIKVEK